MSTLSEHTENGNSPATRLHVEDTKTQMDDLLQQFDVFPSRFDRFLFQYFSAFLIGGFSLQVLLGIAVILLGYISYSIEAALLSSGAYLLVLVAFISIVWRFNVWRRGVPKTLRDLIEKKRIAVPDGDATTPYLRFLEEYRDALASPKRYVLSSLLMILVVITYVPALVQDLSAGHSTGNPSVLVTLLVVGTDLIGICVLVAAMYSIGIVIWDMYISGWYIRKLVRVFELSIQPFHTDQYGGLKLLGNFCFGLVSPILIGSGLLIGYILLGLFFGTGGDVVQITLVVGFVLLLVVLFALPAAVFAFLLPLRDIHTKMVRVRETDEDSYNARIEALREETQALLASKQVEAAKAVQEEKAVVETLHTPYPTWPFHVRSKIFSTVLGVSGSILIGVLTAALQQYISTLLSHTP